MSGGQLCGQCLKSPPSWDSAVSPLIYAWPLDQLLQRFKFHHDLATGELLGGLLAEFLAASLTTRPDVLIPVPLHPARLRARGFNQALELARPLQARWQLRVDHNLCIRQKNTAVQSTLDARKRHRNLRGAFTVRQPLDRLHVAILDDVMTTGATMHALAQAVRAAGAARVTAWSLARAVRLP